MALAFRLEQRLPAAEVLVLEEQARVGGTIGTLSRDGFRVETGPNGFLDSKPSTIDLCRELGLGDRLIAASEAAGRNRFVLLDGRLRRLPSGLFSFLASDVLSWRAKFRLLTERYRRPRREPADESIDAFARRRAGDEIAETLADAFVTGIHAGDPRLLSVRAAFPRLAAFEREHGSVSRGFDAARRRRRAEATARGETAPRPGRMWSFREGLVLLVDTLRERLHTPPVTGVSVRAVEHSPSNGHWRVRAKGRDAWTADALVLTCPAYRQAELLADLDRTLADEIGAIAYNRVAVVALGYRAADVPVSTEGFGYLSPQRSRRDVLGVQWCSSIFPDRAPPGLVLLRAMCGGWHRPEVVDWDNDRLLQAVRDELGQTMRIQSPPVFHSIVRWHRAIPQYHLGHLERVARIAERLARHGGLFVGGNAYHGVAMNDCVERADGLTERVAAFLRQTKN